MFSISLQKNSNIIKVVPNTTWERFDMEKEFLAYIGGLFDGDGSFSLSKKMDKKGKSPLYFPLIQYGTTNKKEIEFLYQNFGGIIAQRKSHIGKDGSNHKTSYTWRLEKKNKCYPFLTLIEPYLILKKERVKFLISYIENHPFIRGSKGLSKEELLQREEAYIKMLSYNKKASGSTHLSNINYDKSLFWPYMAGIFDTDGSFSIRKNKGRKSFQFSPFVQLSMKDCQSIIFLIKNIKIGNLCKPKQNHLNRNQIFKWSCSNRNDVKNFLENIIPFLRFKKEQAKVLLEYCDSINLMNHRQKGISKEENEKRFFYYKKILCLNKHGVYKPSLIDLEVPEQDDRAQAGVSCAG